MTDTIRPEKGRPEKGRPENGKRRPTTPKKPSRVADPLHHAEILAALRSFKRGDFSVRIRNDMTGTDGQLA
ncbi:MAG TPA: hypothetical protein VFQ65_10910 [Kofleriaceae bacterium]|nr:hypothetical protein [Kofleriaceae bacterium]